MSDPVERPTLRVVRPDERRAKRVPEVKENPPLAIPQPQPSPGLISFKKSVEGLDLDVPRNSALLACAGGYVAEQALGFHHQAVAGATPGTFRRDVTPGRKSVESTRAWLETHLDDLRRLARSEQVIEAYARGEDLREAALLAGTELDRATAVVSAAGLSFDDRAQAVFADAEKTLTVDFSPVVGEIVYDYWLGTDVLGSF